MRFTWQIFFNRRKQETLSTRSQSKRDFDSDRRN